MIPADKRYRDDPQFKMLVDTMYAMIARLDYTPTEIREAAMLAQLKYEMGHPRPVVFSAPMLEEIRMAEGNHGSCPHCGRKWTRGYEDKS